MTAQVLFESNNKISHCKILTFLTDTGYSGEDLFWP